jgi:5-methyltetrahydropteroyltriglutamate--homocysteine methyltransferase
VDFLSGFDGVTQTTDAGTANFKGVGTEEMPPVINVTGRIVRSRPVFVDYFKYLKTLTGRTPKMTLPAPAMLHHRAGYRGVSKAAYPDREQFWEDVGAAYRAEIRDLAAAGCTYLQIDDTSYSMLCDEKFRAMVRDRGDDPDELVHTYAHAIALALRDRPQGMRVAMHTCRGNFMSSWVAEGGYEKVAEVVFNEVPVDAFFLEYDSDRAGGFEPLRFMPKDKVVVLGLVTTKLAQLESPEALKRRIDQASAYVPLERLCLSPQCGFASTHHGNRLTAADQWAKLRLVVDVAREVWGDS